MSLTEQLFGSSQPAGSAAPNITFDETKKTNLDLFAVAPQARKESRREKRRRLEDEAKQQQRKGGARTEGGDEGASQKMNVLDNVLLLPTVDERDEGKTPKRTRLRHALTKDPEEDNRTVFVGNLPNDVDKKAIHKSFRDCGDIDSIRIRNQVLEAEQDKKRGRAIRVLRGEVKQGDQYSSTAYVVFAKKDSVAKALTKTGLVLSNRHIFVTRVNDDSKAFPPNTSIFLGNLSYDTNEEDVWNFFVQHGVPNISRVRLVRDKETGEGKGFGYVEFTHASSVEPAIATRGNKLKDRDVRICHVTKDKKAPSRQASRREVRKELTKTSVSAGPQKRGAGSQQQQQVRPAKPAADTPSWMGLATNPRKKLARDLRPLVTESGPKKKMGAKKSFAPQAKRKTAPPSS